MRKTLPLLIVAAGLVVAFATGCSSSTAPEAGYKKEDFSKRPPPPGYGPAGAAPASNGPPASNSGK